MYFRISPRKLLRHLADASRVIDAKSPMQVLSYFHISLSQGVLTITGSNVEMRLETCVDCDVANGQGSFLVDAKRFLDVVKAIPEGVASFCREGNVLTISHTTGRFAVPTLDATDYPAKAEASAISATFTLPISEASTALAFTSFAAGTDPLRPQMAGVFFDAKHDSLTLVATDTRCLARYICREITPGCETSFLLPTRAADILQRMLQGVKSIDAVLRLSVTDNQVICQIGDDTLWTQYPKGRFPDYNRVIPAEDTLTTKISSPRKALSEAIGRVSVMKNNMDCVILRIADGQINVETRDDATGSEAQDTVGCNLFGGDQRIGFNGIYLKTIVDALPGDEIHILINDPTRPALFLPTDETIGLTTLCMPMNI